MRLVFKFGTILLLGLWGTASAVPDGCGCGKELAQTPTTLVSISGLDTAAAAASEKIAAEATSAVNSITFDSSAATDWLKNSTKDMGWTAEKLAEAVSKMISDATGQLNAKIKAELPKMIADAKKTFDESVKKLTPQVKFQADLTWKERCCDQAAWADSAANKAGVTGADGEGKLDVTFDIGASVGVSATTKASITASIAVGIKLTGFNPVRPKTGTGASFTITATPTYDWNVKASAGGGVLLKITVGAGLTGSQTLNDVKGALTCS